MAALESMLRVHCLLQWYNQSDAVIEYSLYEITSMRRFVHLSLGRSIPDHTIIMNFSRLLEKHDLGCETFDAINRFLES